MVLIVFIVLMGGLVAFVAAFITWQEYTQNSRHFIDLTATLPKVERSMLSELVGGRVSQSFQASHVTPVHDSFAKWASDVHVIETGRYSKKLSSADQEWQRRERQLIESPSGALEYSFKAELIDSLSAAWSPSDSFQSQGRLNREGSAVLVSSAINGIYEKKLDGSYKNVFLREIDLPYYPEDI